MIRGRFADEALEILKFQPQRGARMLEKVLQSALGNAQDPDNPANKDHMVKFDHLIVKEAAVDGGPMYKRIRPRARGTAYMVLRRFAHIRVELEEL
jgi:large subunit ribosomal protein L22